MFLPNSGDSWSPSALLQHEVEVQMGPEAMWQMLATPGPAGLLPVAACCSLLLG